MECHHCEVASGGKKSSAFRWLIIRTLVAATCSIPLLLHMFGVKISLGLQGVLATIVQFFSGWPFYVGFFREVKRLAPHMDSLVTLGTSAAYLFSFYSIFKDPTRGIYFETSSVLITFILIGRLMELHSREKAESGMQALLAMQPNTARIKKGNDFVEVKVEMVQKGDQFMVRPGEKVPVDGEIVEGRSAIDESMLTGESGLVEKDVKDPLFAGTINQHGMVIAKATKVGGETALSRIIHLVAEAKKSRAPIQRVADVVAGFFVPSVLVVALLTWILWTFVGQNPKEGIINAIAVLIIACPCALGLATPIVITVSCGIAAGEGIFIKNAEAIEKAQKIKKIIIDKTNTVTEGVLKVEKFVLDLQYLPLVKTLCEHSEHPASQAILEDLKQKNVSSLPSMALFRSIPGRGVSGYFDNRNYFLGSPLFLKEEKVPTENLDKPLEEESGMIVAFGTEKLSLGYFVLSDQIRKGSKEAIMALKGLKIETVMMTGDRKKVAEKVAKELAFDSYKAQVLPEEKARVVQEAKKEGKVTAMVGDGVNDAPALAAADVGFAIASGTDVAMESASVGLMRSHIQGVADTIILSKAAFKKIIQNLIFAFGYNTLGIPLAALGFLNPIIAGAAMALSSVSVVFNALLLKNTYTNKSRDSNIKT